MPQVIIVSNRLPVSVKKEDGQLQFLPSLGGLATGLASYVKDKQNLWIGWPGISSDELTERDRQAIVLELAKHNCSPVFLTRRQVDEYYNGYSNAILWPLFHDLPYRSPRKHKNWWQSYRRVNMKFAEAVFSGAQKNSHIWVHDYQLMLLPHMLRSELPSASIGYFLHIPFPGVKVLGRLPERKKLLEGVLGADLAGFHTPGYVGNFLDNCQAAGAGIADYQQVALPGRVVRVADFPMGIDYQKYAGAAKSRTVKAAVRRYRKRYKGQKVIAAVDRMDPSKGLVERLVAYREYLRQTPAMHGKVVFSMIAAPSRTDIAAYKNLSRKLGTLVNDINVTFGSSAWQPVDYIDTAQPFEEVTALFQVADVAFIAPLRDGMNLAAKEFVASKRKSGVLILSETAGAARELQDALIVNPHQPATLVAGLQQALTMPKRELRSRLKVMQKHLATNTVQTWAKTFVDTLQQPVPGTKPRAKALKGSAQAELLLHYREAKKRLLLLDYDGSLVPFSEDYKATKPPKSLLALLQALCSDPSNEVVIVSGRKASNLEDWLGSLPIGLVAEHGGATKKKGHKHWQTIERSEIRWKRVVEPVLTAYAAETPGARVETKLHSLVWHYRASPPYYAQKYTVIIKRVLKPLLRTYNLQIFQGNKILEIKDPRVNKGSAIQSWLKRNHDFVLVIGDDFTDEDMFAAMPSEAYSVKVGRGGTLAHFRLQTYQDARKLLQRLIK